MRIIGSIPELTRGGNIGSGPIKMKRARKKFRWMYDKFGTQIRPLECQLKMSIDRIAKFKDIIYSYSKSDAQYSRRDEFIYEREPSRILEIQTPESYRGELGLQKSSQWKNWDKVWIINGHIEKADGNFLGDLFYSKIGDTGISVGTYPLGIEDCDRILSMGVTGVLNVMTHNDYK